MDLFNLDTSPYKNNYLPQDGTVLYLGKCFNCIQADFHFQTLFNNIEWRNDEAIIFGKKIITKRKVAWYGDQCFEYTYSNITKKALPWTQNLLNIKEIVEQITNEQYNSCLLNLYHDGSEGMAWHSDGEKDLKKNGAIASVSFGAERKFSFKHKTNKQKIDLLLEHGSIMVMKDQTQDYWLHRLAPSTRIRMPRINLTFRSISI